MANTACQGQDLSAPEDWTQAFYPPVAYTSIEGKFLKTENPRDSIGCEKSNVQTHS